MNFNYRSKIIGIFVFFQFVCFLHASEHLPKDEAPPSTPPALFRLSSIVEQAQAVYAKAIGTQQLLENPEILYNFYQTNVACPAGIDPELFKKLVEISLNQHLKRGEQTRVLRAYFQDQAGISSDFGKTLVAEALLLMREPFLNSPIDLKKLPLLSRIIPTYLEPSVKNMRQRIMLKGGKDANGNPNYMIEESARAACQMFDRGPMNLKSSIMKMPGEPFRSVDIIYDALNYTWCEFENFNPAMMHKDNREKAFKPFFAVVQHLIQSGEFRYYLLPLVDVSIPNFEEQRTQLYIKFKLLYGVEKLKYLLDEEKASRELITEENDAQRLLMKNLKSEQRKLRQALIDSRNKKLAILIEGKLIQRLCDDATHGRLLQVRFDNLIAKVRDAFTKELESEGCELQNWVLTNKLLAKKQEEDRVLQERLNKEKEKNEALRLEKQKKIMPSIVKHHCMLQRYDANLPTILVSEQYAQAVQRRFKKYQEVEPAMREHQKRLQRYDANLSTILVNEEKYKATQEWGQNLSCALHRENNNLVAARYLQKIENFVVQSRAHKKAIERHKAFTVARLQAESRINDPYKAVVLDDDHAIDESNSQQARGAISANVNFVGWAQASDGNYWYYPGAGHNPRYWNPHTRLLE